MAVAWTPGQREIIENRNQDLLVSAAAGSGKTAVLVEHILSLLLDEQHPLDVDQLLVVTFTKAAAAEMRERIGHRLDELLEEHPEQEHLRRQQVLLHQAHISTIDSFCMWVVKNHFHELEIDPDFRIAEEGEEKLLQADVLREMLEEHYRKEEESFLRFVDAYTGGKNDDSLRELILRLYRFGQSAPYPRQWLQKCRDPFDPETGSLDEFPFVQALTEELDRELTSLEGQLTYAAQVMCLWPEVNPAYENTFLLDRGLVQEVLQAKGFSEKVSRLASMKFSRKPAKKRGQEPSEGELRCSELRDFVKEECTRLKKKYALGSPEQMQKAILGSARALTVLVDLTLEFGERLEAAKRERSLADFSDVEHWALQLLDRSPVVAEELSRRFAEIIIDEYQDSNLIQEKILTAISRGPRGGHNLFMVGDVKQSIYKFRMARPELFMEKYARYAVSEAGEKKIDLSCNFRSRSTVLDSTNHLFYQLMGEELGGISYTDEVALHAGADYPPPPEGCDLTTELLLIDGEEGDGLADSREWEAKVIADRIRELTAPESKMRIWDGKQGAYRPVCFRDIVILLRTMDGWAESFVRVLMQEGIPAVAEQRKGYFAAREVQLLLNLLQIIDNPCQDIPLMSVLVSPIGGFSEEEIAVLTAESRAETEQVGTGRGLYQACRKSTLPKMQAFLAQLSDYRERSRYLPIHQLLAEILEETGYLHYLSALPAGENRRANVEMLQEMARNFEQTSYHGIFQFNRYMEQIRKYDVDYGEASILSEQDDLVRITSIHKSKGLEFPVVFVAGMGKQINLQDARQTVILHEDLGLASDYLDREHGQKQPTLWKRYVADRLAKDVKAEELRVLYVAMTRAREKLILTGTVKSPGEKWRKAQLVEAFPDRLLPAWYVGSASSYLDWLFMGLVRGSQGFRIQNLTAGTVLEAEMGRQGRHALRREELEDLDSDIVYDAKARASLESWRNYQYPYPAATELKSAVSVSELKTEQKNAEKIAGNVPRLPEDCRESVDGSGDRSSRDSGSKAEENTENKKPLQPSAGKLAADRGTAYHLLLQKIPPEEGTELSRVRDYLEQFCREGRISQEVAAKIRPRELVDFFRSPLGGRIQKAAVQGRYFTEQPFVLGLPAREVKKVDSDEMILVQGIIDAYLEEEDGLVLLDYKTDRIRPGEEQVLVERYQIQLEYYRRALEAATGRPVKEGWLYSFALGKAVRVFE